MFVGRSIAERRHRIWTYFGKRRMVCRRTPSEEKGQFCREINIDGGQRMAHIWAYNDVHLSCRPAIEEGFATSTQRCRYKVEPTASGISAAGREALCTLQVRYGKGVWTWAVQWGRSSGSTTRRGSGSSAGR